MKWFRLRSNKVMTFLLQGRTRLIMLQSTSDDQTIDWLLQDCCIIDAMCIAAFFQILSNRFQKKTWSRFNHATFRDFLDFNTENRSLWWSFTCWDLLFRPETNGPEPVDTWDDLLKQVRISIDLKYIVQHMSSQKKSIAMMISFLTFYTLCSFYSL